MIVLLQSTVVIGAIAIKFTIGKLWSRRAHYVPRRCFTSRATAWGRNKGSSSSHSSNRGPRGLELAAELHCNADRRCCASFWLIGCCPQLLIYLRYFQVVLHYFEQNYNHAQTVAIESRRTILEKRLLRYELLVALSLSAPL
jgi:hypothetical protein